ncbi:IS3 family transposase [Salimicrobium salexigens]|uniref:Integrase core domain-containing protein n=1 Tax=Salimicrobium salexigens TaxID=908941 RepID=A0ABY1KVC4_9BACI|nr:Integrase core domain-containing protein [Salimicrobium salexigens]
MRDIQLFHTDRGNEFKNQLIEELLETFDIGCFLSEKGRPYDNAVAEATYKVLKTEFIYGETFEKLKELELALFNYVHWYNNIRFHGTIDYLTPAAYRRKHLNEMV